MPTLRGFSTEPRFIGTCNLVLPTVAANTNVETGYTVGTGTNQVFGLGALDSSMAVHVQAIDPNSGAVALPIALGLSHAYLNSTDGKLYIRFINPTVATYNSAATVTFGIVGY